MPLDTRVVTLIILITVAVWLYITQKLREQVKKDPRAVRVAAVEIDCERFPDQCPCTMELGKGIA
jgi:hypothetical protein